MILPVLALKRSRDKKHEQLQQTLCHGKSCFIACARVVHLANEFNGIRLNLSPSLSVVVIQITLYE